MKTAVLLRSLKRSFELRKGGEKMKYFLVLSTLTDEGRKTVLTNPERIRQVNKAIEAKETKIVSQYALLSAYHDRLLQDKKFHRFRSDRCNHLFPSAAAIL
jgi:hypothetical protein